MAQATSPASGQRYGVRRVCQAWDVPRSSFYAARKPTPDSTLPRPPARPPTRRGPKSAVSDAALLAAIRQDLTLSPSTGEGHRKVWARLRAFQRSYDSGRTGVGSVLGPGWRHGFDLSAVPDSDGFEGMAATSPRNGIFSIAAIFVMLDLLNTSGSQPLDRLVISTLIAQFWMEQLTGNVFRISRPGAIETFVRTGTARWSEPAGSSSTLTVGTGNACNLATGDGDVLQLGTASAGQPGSVTSWTSAAGARVDFNYADGNLTTVTSNLGCTLTLAYRPWVFSS